MELVSIVLAGLLVLVSCVYLFLRHRYNYWTRRGFPTLPNQRLLFGHVKGINSERHASYVNRENYQALKSRGEAFGGINTFIIPMVVLVDPELIKTILVKDFSVFHDRGLVADPEADPLSGTLFALEGKAWRTLRQKMTPTFTSGKMKQMFGTIVEVAERLRQHVDEHSQEGRMEMKDILARFTTDVIGTCAFGIECNTLKDPDSEFRKYGNMVFEQKVSTLFKITFILLARNLSKRIGVKITDSGVEKFFMNLVRETVEYREKHNVQRNDFLNLLIQIKNKGSVSDKDEANQPVGTGEVGITMNELTAQVFIFFLAGFETSSTTMNFCLYELAKNPRIQERLREEINKAIAANAGELTYDVVMGIEYLDNVINETLRKYPPLETITRAPERDYTIPGTTHVIPKGTLVQIPIYALQHDPDYFPEPERFDPDRFQADVVSQRPPYVYMPFGEGPRICIGLRFGMMQVKLGLITMLRQFRFSPTEDTPERITFMPNVFVLSPDRGSYLRVDKI
uniref:Cytochrome P450 n=1 Tax=Anopheles atroparvus TaxID=41427 RepID=A0A8W7NXJ4_ANOAO